MTNQIHQLHREVETLHIELAASTERYDQQVRKYSERKLKTKEKLHKARQEKRKSAMFVRCQSTADVYLFIQVFLVCFHFRELFNQEKNKLKNEVAKLKEELTLLKAMFVKETEWKLQLEENYKRAMQEKRDLLAQ